MNATNAVVCSFVVRTPADEGHQYQRLTRTVTTPAPPAVGDVVVLDQLADTLLGGATRVVARQWWYPPHMAPWLPATAAAALDVIVEVGPGPYMDDASPDVEASADRES